MSLPDATRHYINGTWTAPASQTAALINPATEEEFGRVGLGTADDVNAAVAAARAAFDSFASTPVKDRFDMLKAINDALMARNDEIADAIRTEMGAPVGLARQAQAPSGVQHFSEILKVLEDFKFEELKGTTLTRHEPVGVCALITPWNWPLNQIATKVAPAIAAGCTMVLKPSELAPLSAVIIADIIDKVGVPAGVFNMVHGNGLDVGAPLTAHEDIDMISFTGSTRAGVEISKAAAPGIKRVSLELGGKSASIVMPSADLQKAVQKTVFGVMINTGQSCNATTRLLVPEDQLDAALQIAGAVADQIPFGDPTRDDMVVGPLANKAQHQRVQDHMARAEAAGAVRASSKERETPTSGYFVAPSVYGGVTETMDIAREEVFGPVIVVMPYKDIDDAVRIANDSDYGLSGAVHAGDREEACAVAARMRTGMVHINGAGLDSAAPFGGYKKSGNGREWGEHGLHEFLEVKSIYGAASK